MRSQVFRTPTEMDQSDFSHTEIPSFAHHIVWGDAKAANVLADINGDVYLIDFGGGYGENWVEKDLSNSIDGDLQGLENIKQYLFE